MNKAYVLPGVFMIAALAVGIVGVSPAFSDEKLSLEQVPAAVRATIEAQAGQGTIAEIEMEVENGHVVYEAEIVVDGKETEVAVSATGALLENDDEDEADDDDESEDDGDEEEENGILLKDSPQAVQDALARLAPGTTIEELTRETEHGVEIYEVSYDIDGAEHSIELTDDGYVIESEQEIKASELPPAVAAAISQAFAGAEIAGAELVQQTAYEVELNAGGRKHELVVLANGHVVREDE